MSPAPANDSVVLLSPFFTTAAAAPLSERVCNGAIACPASCKPAATCAIRRGASFLDVDDARLAVSDKASFLIPEDSYLPGQENCAAPCAPAAPSSFFRPAHPCPLSAPTPTPSGHSALAATTNVQRHRLPTPFLLLDSPVFGCTVDDGDLYAESLFDTAQGGVQLDAASECFEKAVQALEMVERPVELGDMGFRVAHPHLHEQAPNADPEAFLPGSHRKEANCSNADAGVAAADSGVTTLGVQQQQPVRRVSSLAGVALEQDLALPQPPACTEAAAAAREGAEGAATPSGRGADEGADSVGAWGVISVAAGAPGWPYTHPVVGVMPALQTDGAPQHQRQQLDAAAAVAEAANGMAHVLGDAEAVPLVAAAPPAQQAPTRAFHHKTGGPCDHCGATESPQWRRGPPAKPMLCNACGTRYRRTNQLNPAAAYTPAGRAAAAAAAAAAAQQQTAAAKRVAKQSGGNGSSKRGRASYY